MNSNKNIVLIGMMGSGKTTCGHMLAQRLNRPFVDCDTVIEGFTGRAISDLFASDGEEAFRELESQVVPELGAQSGLVIATGGGVVLRQANVAALRDNGTIVFLNRPAEEIYDALPKENRPLAQAGRQAFLDTFSKRLPSYRTAADVMVFDFSSPEATVEEILDKLSSEETPLSESLSLYAQAAELIAFCDETLKQAQIQIDEIDAKLDARRKAADTEES